MSDWIVIDKADDFNQLRNFLSRDYSPHIVASELRKSISNAVKGVFIEYEYIDKDYRSTFTIFMQRNGGTIRINVSDFIFLAQVSILTQQNSTSRSIA